MLSRFCLFVISSCILISSSLFACETLLNQEDTLKYNIYKMRNLEEPFILHAALEGPNAIVGGLGCVLRDLSNELRKDFNNCFTIIPFYEFLRESLSPKGQAISLGFFKHPLFNRFITTEVFFNKVDRQFLFSPDESVNDCYNIVTGRDTIYESTQNFLRILYFNSAIAKFSDLVDTDILQLHAWQTNLAAPLLKKIYNPSRSKKNLNEIKIVSTIHMFSEEQGIDTGKMYEFVGLEEPKNGLVNLAATMILESDVLTTVSQGLTTYFTDPLLSYGLETLFKNKQGFIQGITNGINYSKFNPFLEENLGPLHLKDNFSISKLKIAKQSAKNILWANSLIPSQNKPLMLYVGRFSDEKGNDFLEPIIDKWLSMGGQMVLMGILTQDQRSSDKISFLRSRQLKDLRIYTDLKKDQLDFISNSFQVQKGNLLRFAADFVAIPSKVESCGLIAMESLSFGTPVFTSWVQGLKDMCFPYGVDHPLLNKVIDKTDFNAVSFQYYPEDKERTVKEINTNLELTYKIATGEELGLDSLLYAQKRMIESSEGFDWRGHGGALAKYKELYRKLIGNSIQKPELKLSHESLLDKKDIMQLLTNKFGTYPPEKIVFKYKKYQKFVLTTLKNGKREPETQYNIPNLKEKTRVNIYDQMLYVDQNNTSIFDTEALKQKNESFYITWVLNKKGELFAGAFCHAYFLKSKPGLPYYGYGKPVACAGDIIVKKGKITYIDNRSGHYEPNEDQFLLALHYFNSLGLLDEKCDIREEGSSKQIALEKISTLDTSLLMSKYPSLKKIIEEN